MLELLHITIGGIPIALHVHPPQTHFDIQRPVTKFISSAEPTVNLRVHCGSLFPEIDARLVFDSQVTWQMLSRNTDWLVKVGMQETFQLGIFRSDFSQGDIYVAPSLEEKDAFIFPLDYPMGEVLLMNLLATHRGVMMHAAGVIYQGGGYLFAGHGGVGKSTTSRLWQATPGAVVVNDDKVILRWIDGQYRMFGTPWHGEGGMAEPLSAPLKRIFILKQAKENRLNPIPTVQAAAMLLARAFVPLWDAGRMDSAIQFMGDLLQVIPCEQYGFLPDTSAVEFIQSL